MTRIRRTEDHLEALSRLRQSPRAPETCTELRKYLTNKSNLVVAKAAKLAAEFELQDLGPQLVGAFNRFMKDPAKTDKRCEAKTEIVRALEAWGAAEAEVFLVGIRHVQMEGSFGPPVDTAAPLRAACAMGLVHMLYPDAIFEIVTLLVDPEDDARIGAVRALAYSGRPGAEALLRLKVLAGEASVDVVAECFTTLMALSPERSLKFVSEYLDSDDPAIVEAAALALGQSHAPAAIEILKSKWQRCVDESLRRALLVAMAVAREDTAFEFLFSLVENATEKTAAQAVAALAMYRHDERIRSRVESIARTRTSPSLDRTVEAEFGPPHS